MPPVVRGGGTPATLSPCVRLLVTWTMRRLAGRGGAADALVDALRTVRAEMPWRRRDLPAPAPALRHLPAAVAAVDEADALATAVRDCVDEAAWDTYYDPADPWAAPFIDEFSSSHLIGPAGPYVSDTVQLALALYGPGLHYPPHGHASAEAYLIASGRATADIAGTTRVVAPGAVVLHDADAVHAYRVDDDAPLLLAWARCGDLAAPVWAPQPDGGRHHPAPVR